MAECCTTSICGGCNGVTSRPQYTRLLIRQGRPETLLQNDHRGAHLDYGINPVFPAGVQPGKYQEPTEHLVKDWALRQRHCERVRRNEVEIRELRSCDGKTTTRGMITPIANGSAQASVDDSMVTDDACCIVCTHALSGGAGGGARWGCSGG